MRRLAEEIFKSVEKDDQEVKNQMVELFETNGEQGTTVPKQEEQSAKGGRVGLAERLDSIERKLDYLSRPIADGEKKNAVLMNRVVEHVENHWLTRSLLLCFGLLAALTFYSFLSDQKARTEERAARAEEAEFRRQAQIATAWETLLVRVGGNVGKGDAINVILGVHGSLDGADLSCESKGREAYGSCLNQPIFTNINSKNSELLRDRSQPIILQSDDHPARLEGIELRNIDFSGVNINGFYLRRSSIRDINFSNVEGTHFGFRDVEVSYNSLNVDEATSGFRCSYCSFENMLLPWQFLRNINATSLAGSTVLFPPGTETKAEDSIFRNSVIFSVPIEFGTEERTADEKYHLSYHDWKMNNLPLVLRAEENSETIEQSLQGDIESRIFWDFYHNSKFCLDDNDATKFDVPLDVDGAGYIYFTRDTMGAKAGDYAPGGGSGFDGFTACGLTYFQAARAVNYHLLRMAQLAADGLHSASNVGFAAHCPNPDLRDPRVEVNDIECRFSSGPGGCNGC